MRRFVHRAPPGIEAEVHWNEIYVKLARFEHLKSIKNSKTLDVNSIFVKNKTVSYYFSYTSFLPNSWANFIGTDFFSRANDVS